MELPFSQRDESQNLRIKFAFSAIKVPVFSIRFSILIFSINVSERQNKFLISCFKKSSIILGVFDASTKGEFAAVKQWAKKLIKRLIR